ARLGQCQERRLEKEMKRGEIVVLAVLFMIIALGVFVWALGPVLLFLFMLATDPAGSGCGEGSVTDNSATNARGDVVEGYIKGCTGFGAVVDNSIVLQLRGAEKTTTLAEYDDAQSGYPKFRWIDDDTLMIDLGEVGWVSPKTGKVGSIRITYAYSKAETSGW
ncbi:MAG TPA: hypothetical protein VHT02_10795, partial [Methylocella sp.]|nr:hypothetical protein [Methylocella sp.]